MSLGGSARSRRDVCRRRRAISTVLFLYLGWFVFSGDQKPTDMQRLASVVFWFGLPLLWAAALIGTGIRILTRRDRHTENCRLSDALSDRADNHPNSRRSTLNSVWGRDLRRTQEARIMATAPTARFLPAVRSTPAAGLYR